MNDFYFFTFSYCPNSITDEFLQYLRIKCTDIHSVAEFILNNSNIRAEFYRFIHDDDI